MFRTFRIATLSALMMVVACKTSDKPAERTPEATRKAATPAAPALPNAKPGDPAASPPDPTLPAADNSELETKGLAMMQQLADMFEADAKDCEKLAADIKTFVSGNKDLLAQVAAMEQRQSDEQRQAFATRNAAAQAAVAKKMQGAMAACVSNPSVLAAMKTFPTP